MKKNLPVFIIFLLIIPYALFAQFPYQYNNENTAAGFEKRFYEKLLQNDSKGVGDNYDLKYHRFNWYIDPDTSYISGSVTSYFVTKQGSFSHVQFELSPYLTVDSVKYSGTNVGFSHIASVLDIDLGTSLSLGILDSLTVYYQGNPDAGVGFGSFIKTDHNGTPVIWTLSEPYGASDWWPCKNILSDKIDSIDVFVTTPLAYRVASNGILVSETVAGSDKVFHWKHRYPIAAYLIAIGVTNYSVYTDKVPLNGDTLDMLNYVYPEDLAAFQAGTAAQIPVLQLYDSLFGDYPYMKEKYGQCEFGWGGGMEHQTMSFVINAGFDLLAHEMSHQWYGDKVTCASWHDIWVNESFATYCQGLTLNFMMGGYWWPTWKRDKIDYVTSLPDGSVYCYDTTSVARVFDGRLSYAKGAMVLHMLRWEMGDSAFFQGMKDIIADPALAYNYAFTADIQNHFETVSGLDLDEFFTDWIYSEGYPTYTISCTFLLDSTVNTIIQQTQSHASVTYFELPVPIRFKGQGKDTILVFDNTFSGETYNSTLNFIPDSAYFDPDQWLLAKLNSITFSHGVGIPENSEYELVISPNPADHLIMINCYSGILGSIIISDITGRVCKTVPADGLKSLNIDISDLSSGIYVIRMTTSNNILSAKFVKD
jgi:aminopeptidase N